MKIGSKRGRLFEQTTLATYVKTSTRPPTGSADELRSVGKFMIKNNSGTLLTSPREAAQFKN